MPYNTVLIKEGLAAARKTMDAYGNQKTILKPIIKSIPVKGAQIEIRIFKPDMILAVV